MVTIALKSEVLFVIIGVGAVFVTVCVAAALCYTCHRRRRRSKGGGMQGEITEARARSRRDGERRTAERTPGEVLLPVEEETKIAASATSFPGFEPPGGVPASTLIPVQPRFSQSARLDPQLFQQTFSTYESFYRAQCETTSVPPSPRSASGAWPAQSTARTRETPRLTNATLADIALRLPSTPTELSMAGTWIGAAQEPADRASLTTASVRPQRSRTHKSMPDIIYPPAAGSPRLDAFQATEVPPSPRPLPTAGARGSPAGGSALASRRRSRSVGLSTIPPPAYGEVRGAGQRYPPPIARSKGAATKYPARSLESSGDVRLAAPLAKSASAQSNVSRPVPGPLHEPGRQPRSYFDD